MPVAIRATADAGWQELLRVVIAAVRAGAGFVLSTPVGLPSEVRHALGDLGAVVFMEIDDEWIERMRRRGESAGGETLAAAFTGGQPVENGAVRHPDRVRLVGSRDSVAALHRVLAEAVAGDPDLAVYDGEVTSAGRIELLPFLHEQAIAITAHRYGNPDPWSASVI